MHISLGTLNALGINRNATGILNFLKFKFKFFKIFSHTLSHVGLKFPDQRGNLQPLHWKAESESLDLGPLSTYLNMGETEHMGLEFHKPPEIRLFM